MDDTTQAATPLPDFASDISLDVASRAHAGTSHTPDDRGRFEIAGYVAQLTSDLAALTKIADTDEKRAVLATEFAAYRAGYRAAMIRRLEAKSRCVSTMIAGPARFNTRRAGKTGDAADRATQNASEFRERTLARIAKLLRPEDQPIRAGDADAVERLRAEIARGEEEVARMKAANAAIRKNAKQGPSAQVEALVALGFAAKTAGVLLQRDALGNIGFPGYKLTNMGATIRRQRERLAYIEQAKATPDATVEGAVARIEESAADNRVRLFFPGKPGEKTREQLKANGFRWTPSLGCWQAFRNPEALRVANEIACVGSEE